MLMRLLISGRRRQDDGFAIARHVCLHACRDCYPLIMHLHRFFIVVARIAVNHDPACGTAPNPTVWSVGAPAKKKISAARSRLSVCSCSQVQQSRLEGMDTFLILPPDFDCWPYSTGLLVKFSLFFLVPCIGLLEKGTWQWEVSP